VKRVTTVEEIEKVVSENVIIYAIRWSIGSLSPRVPSGFAQNIQ
jgi:hypothetical protein